MASKVDQLSHEQKLLLVNVVRLVVNHDDSALKVMKQTFADESLSCETWLGFEFYRTEDWSNYCDCWFEWEYLDFINRETIDRLMLERVLKNLVEGSCIHAKSAGYCVQERYYTGISFMHVAAGAGNRTVLKYLLKCNLLIHQKSESCYLYPPHLAIIKSRTKLLKMMLQPDCKRVCIHSSMSYAPLILAKRRASGINITKLMKCDDTLKCFMIIYADMEADLVNAIIKYGKRDNGAANVIAYFICRNDTTRALQFLSTRQLAYKYLPIWHVDVKVTVILASIMYDNVSILRTLPKRNQLQQWNWLGYNALDIATAFGSTNCAQILKSFITPTESLMEEVSPYVLVCYLAGKEPRMLDEEIAALFKKCKDQGHDVNHQDKYQMTPLHVELDSRTKEYYDAFLIKSLLSLGADINSKDCNGRTPIHVLLTAYDSPFGSGSRASKYHSRGILKDLLYYNPIAELTPSAMNFAALCEHSAIAHIELATHITYLKRKSETDDINISVEMTYTERVLAVSYVALMYEIGFKIHKSDRTYISKWLPTISKYVDSIESTPWTLKACCRRVIRKTHPGDKLHKYLDEIGVPTALKNYILFSHLLKYVQLKTVDRYSKEPITVSFDMEYIRSEANLIDLLD